MYETPSRSGSRLSTRRPPNLAAPSLSNLNLPPGSSGAASTSTSNWGGSSGSSGSMSSAGWTTPGPVHASSQARGGLQPPSSPLMPPQTPQQRLLLRKPMSMQQLSSVRSSPRLGTPLTGAGVGAPGAGEVYKGKIHVGVRARPEDAAVTAGVWFLDGASNTVEHDAAGSFQFDRVYTRSDKNDAVFQQSVEPLIDQVVAGYNATVFAYGTTGSGKTYTMQGSPADPGVIPRSVRTLFESLNASGHDGLVRLSYFEIYNERVYDLLSADNKPTEVTLRDGLVGETRVVGQREVEARSAAEVLEWVASGDQLRRTSSTQYNEHSSRSHAVVRIHVLGPSSQSVLYLCDLAGSERAVVHSERRKEGSFINKSLLTLSTIISILSQGGGVHVPYRDSKLTRLLQPSLSGTALVSMICTIQTGLPAGGAETLNSVRFAAKAKNIVVTARRNSVFDDGGMGLSMSGSRMLEQLQAENEQLRRDAMKVRAERDELQDRLDVYENGGSASAEESLEAMTGIDFGSDGDHRQTSELSAQTNAALTKALRQASQYKEENDQLHQRISHLVAEIAAIDANLAHLEQAAEPEAAKPTSPSTRGTTLTPTDMAAGQLSEKSDLQALISELKEQLRDKDLLIECLKDINTTRQKIDSWGSASTITSLSSPPSRMSRMPSEHSSRSSADSIGADATAEAIHDLHI